MLVLVRAFSLLPLSMLHVLGSVLGALVYACSPRFRRKIRANARQAGYTKAGFGIKVACQLGKALAELPYIWFRPKQLLKKVQCRNFEFLAQSTDAGVIMISPHLGGFEVIARYVGHFFPFTVMFRPPHKQWIAPIFEAARNTAQVSAVPANLQGIRLLVKALRSQGMIGLLPDQVPVAGDGVLAPFFGRNALTMTLPCKLAAQTQARFIVAGAKRLAWGKGWEIQFFEPSTPLPADPIEQATWMNQAMESLIHQFPEQYLWSYNRYKMSDPTSSSPSHESR